jgi:hypothetical protein
MYSARPPPGGVVKPSQEFFAILERGEASSAPCMRVTCRFKILHYVQNDKFVFLCLCDKFDFHPFISAFIQQIKND